MYHQIHKLLHIDYFRLQLTESSSKTEIQTQVLEMGNMIRTWVVNRKPELTKSLEFTNRAFNIVKQKTGIDLPLIVAKVFVGVGNMIVNSHDKVLHLYCLLVI